MKRPFRILISTVFIGGSILLLSNSCKKDEIINPALPEVTTSDVTEITPSTAVCGGTITSDGGAAITARGVCWSMTEPPTLADNKTSDEGNSFKSTLTGLSPFTTYYVRAYATNKAGTVYGNTVSFATEDGVIDFDGNVYHTIKIGTQTWMVENLKVTHYRNGDPIPNVTDNIAWSKLSTGAYCDYNNDPATGKIYGKLYNYFTITDPRGLCPYGWHIATNEEFQKLTKALGGWIYTAGKLKETDTIHWENPNIGATNETGFTALPGGGRGPWDGKFSKIRTEGNWWNINEYSDTLAYGWNIHHRKGLTLGFGPKTTGLSVRCIMDD